MPPLLVCGLLLAAFATAAPVDLDDWPWDTGFRDPLLHLHPEVNYALHPEWLALWEGQRLAGSIWRGTFGSVSTDDLLVDARWALDRHLVGGLRLRTDVVWQEQRHLPRQRQDIVLGFEQRVWRGLGAVVQVLPAGRKEELDLALGAIWTAPDRTRYLQFSWVWADLVHDEKNPYGGETARRPTGPAWLARWGAGAWSVFSRGTWVSPFARSYPDPGRSPLVTAHEGASQEALVRVRRRGAGGRSHLEASWRLVQDAAGVGWQDASLDHDYAGWYRTLAVRTVWPVAPRLDLRAEAHWVRRRADNSGRGAFGYRRQEFMPAVYGGWSWNERLTTEVGYMGTSYTWQFTGEDEVNGWADKFELALAVDLADAGALRISLSHEPALHQFGGGNIQMITRF